MTLRKTAHGEVLGTTEPETVQHTAQQGEQMPLWTEEDLQQLRTENQAPGPDED